MFTFRMQVIPSQRNPAFQLKNKSEVTNLARFVICFYRTNEVPPLTRYCQEIFNNKSSNLSYVYAYNCLNNIP